MVSRRPLPGRRGSILAWRVSRDLRAGRSERREEATRPAFLHRRHPAGLLARRSDRRLQPDARRPWSIRAYRARGWGRAESARANQLPRGVAWPGFPAGRRSSSPRCPSHATEVNPGHRRREEPAPPCGESLPTAGRPASWLGAKTPLMWPCPQTDVASSIRRGRWTGTSGGSISGGGQRRKKRRPDSSRPPRSTPIPSLPPMASEWRSPRIGAASPRSGSSTGKAGTLSA